MRADGTRGHVYAATKEEASRKLARAIREDEDHLRPVDERTTVGAYLETTVGAFLDQWLELERSTLRPRTWQSYESHVRVHLRPGLGRVKIAKLTPAHVDRLRVQKLEEGLSPATVNRIRATLSSALARAKDLGVVRENVVARSRPAREGGFRARTMSPHEARSFLTATEDNRLHALFVAALGTGMRLGELLGLQWADVDLDRGWLEVRHTLRRRPRGGGWSLDPPKSKSGRRSVPLSPAVEAALRQWRARQGRERLVAGDQWHDHDLVFTRAVAIRSTA